MSQFLYYLPGLREQDATPARLAELGLGHVAGGHGLARAGCRVGPDGDAAGEGGGGEGGGLVVFAGPATRLMPGYRPAEQQWRPGPGGAYWVGLQQDNRPTEASLRRRRFLAGEPVVLGDGGSWTVPIARSLVRGTSLPRRPCLGADGRTWSLAELPEFRQVCDDAERVWPVLRDGGGIEWAELIEVAVRAVGTNYRVAAAEVELLGLFDTTDRCWDCCRALLDIPEMQRVHAAAAEAATREEAEKKSVSAPGT